MTDGKPYPLPETWTESSIGKAVVRAKQRDPRKNPDEVFQYVDVSAVSNTSFKITGAPLRLATKIQAADEGDSNRGNADGRARMSDQKTLFKRRVREWAEKLEVKVVWLGVRPMTNKWASCSSNGHLNFSRELLEMDRGVWDYVIVHELLHLSVPNHGKLWKSLMRAHLGDYEKAEAHRDDRMKLPLQRPIIGASHKPQSTPLPSPPSSVSNSSCFTPLRSMS
jgi:hypothetical protein